MLRYIFAYEATNGKRGTLEFDEEIEEKVIPRADNFFKTQEIELGQGEWIGNIENPTRFKWKPNTAWGVM
jgi:hypothetical protein